MCGELEYEWDKVAYWYKDWGYDYEPRMFKSYTLVYRLTRLTPG